MTDHNTNANANANEDARTETEIDYSEASTEHLESLADMYWRHRREAVEASRAAGPTSGKRWDAHAKKCARKLRAIDDELLRREAESEAEEDAEADEDPNAGKELVTDGGTDDEWYSAYRAIEDMGFFCYSGADGDLYRKNGLAGWRISLSSLSYRIQKKGDLGNWVTKHERENVDEERVRREFVDTVRTFVETGELPDDDEDPNAGKELVTDGGTDDDDRLTVPVGPIKRPDGGDVALSPDDPEPSDVPAYKQGDWLKFEGETASEWIAGKVGDGVVEVED